MQLDFGMNNPAQTETSTWRYCGKMLPKVSFSFQTRNTYHLANQPGITCREDCRFLLSYFLLYLVSLSYLIPKICIFPSIFSSISVFR